MIRQGKRELNHPMRGKYIVFEGVDNSGKTTIASRVCEWLIKAGRSVVMTRHPGSTPAGKQIRALLKHSEYEIDPHSQALLFAADNSLFINQILIPTTSMGGWVIGDRNNFISSIAYQIASGCSFDQLDKVHDATICPVKIDLLFIFRCTWEESNRRRQLKLQTLDEPAVDRYEDGGRAYFDKLTRCYDRIVEEQSGRLLKFVNSVVTLAEAPQAPRCLYIDATRPEDEVFEAVIGALKSIMHDEIVRL